MRRALLLFASLLFLTFSLSAQSSRVFDNFDTSNGVQIYKPESELTAEVTKKNSKGNSSLNNAARTSLVRRIVMSSSRSLRGFTTGDPKVDSYILAASKKHSIDPLLIYSQMHQESAFKLRARSYKGASGLMQLMPATARRFGVTDIFDPRQNIEAGVRYMRWLINKFNGDVVLALAGYNAGEGAVMKYGWQIPPYRETQEYVRRITNRYNSITDSKFVKRATSIDKDAAEKLDEKEAVPLALYEPDVMAVRLPDGSMRLVSQ